MASVIVLPLEGHAGVVTAAVGIVDRVARVDQSARGLEGSLVRIAVEEVLAAHGETYALGNIYANGGVEERPRAQFLNQVRRVLELGVGPRPKVTAPRVLSG